MSVSLLLLCSLLPAQEPGRAQGQDLVEKLSSDSPAERTEAEKKLKALGKAAQDLLLEAARSKDIERASRAKYLLRIIELRDILPASLLRDFPNAPDRLASGLPEWTTLFTEVAARIQTQVPGLSLGTLGRAELETLLPNALRGTRDDASREAVSQIIWNYRLRSGTPALIDLLKDPSLDIRLYACRLLVAFDENPKIAPVLVPLLRDPELCEAAGDALYTHGYWEVIPDIVSLLKSENPRVRKNAASLAAKLRIREVLPILRSQAKDSDPEVRRESFMDRWELADRESLDTYLAGAQDPEAGVRHSAAFALVSGREPQVVRAITQWIENPQYDLLAYAVPAAGKLKIREAVPGLLRLMMTATPAHRDDTASEAAFALALINDATSIPSLVDLLSHKQDKTRIYALQALAAMRATQALPDMERCLNDPVAKVRKTAVLSAGALGGKAALPKILERIQDPDGNVRAACADVLRTLGATEHGAVLLKLLDDSDGLVKSSAFWAVRVLKPEGAMEALVDRIGELSWELPFTLADWGVGDKLPRVRALLSDPRPKARSEAATILAYSKDSHSIPALRRLLDDPVDSVRSVALQALARLGAEGTLEVITKLLSDPESRRPAIWPLSLIGRPAVPLLEKLLLDPNPQLREQIVRNALVSAGQKDAVPALLRSLDDPEDGIRTMALWELVITLDARDTFPAIIQKLEARGDPVWGWLALYSTRAGSTEFLPVILKKARNSRIEDRIRVIESIGQARARNCVQDLRDSLNDPSPTVAGAAAKALGELEDKESIPAIKALLLHKNVAARHGAARALCRLGDPEGAGILVEERHEGSFLLNRLRLPAIWKRLGEVSVPALPRGSRRDRLSKLGILIGIPIELDPAAWDHPDYLDRPDEWDEVRPGSALDALRAVPSVDVILESDRIRIQSRGRADAFWREWWEAQKHK